MLTVVRDKIAGFDSACCLIFFESVDRKLGKRVLEDNLPLESLRVQDGDDDAVIMAESQMFL